MKTQSTPQTPLYLHERVGREDPSAGHWSSHAPRHVRRVSQLGLYSPVGRMDTYPPRKHADPISLENSFSDLTNNPLACPLTPIKCVGHHRSRSSPWPPAAVTGRLKKAVPSRLPHFFRTVSALILPAPHPATCPTRTAQEYFGIRVRHLSIGLGDMSTDFCDRSTELVRIASTSTAPTPHYVNRRTASNLPHLVRVWLC
jgi:hypothetical protein